MGDHLKLVSPDQFSKMLFEIRCDCILNLKELIAYKFNGHYQYKVGDELIKIQSIIGTPCIDEIFIDDDGSLKCSYLFWDGRQLSSYTTKQYYNLPQEDVYSAYEKLYKMAMV